MTETKKTTNKTSTTKTTSSKSSGTTSLTKVMSLLAYVAVCVGGIALFIAFILAKCGISASFVGALQKIANCIGWIVLCLMSFRYISHRRKIWMWVVWAIAIVMIVVGVILV